MVLKSYAARGVDRSCLLGGSLAYAPPVLVSLTREEDGSVSSRKVHRQVVDDASDQIQRLPNNLNDRFDLANPSLIQRYSELKLYLLVHFRAKRIGNEIVAYIVKNQEIPGSNPHVGHDATSKLCPCGSHVLTQIELFHSEASGQQESVLVDNIQTMQSPQNVIRSLIWFDVPDVLYGLIPRALHFSKKSGLVVKGSRLVVKDRKSSVAVDRTAVRSNQQTDGIVEGRSQVLQDVPSDQTNVIRDVLLIRQVVDDLLGFRITLGRDFVGIGLEEHVKSSVELIDVLFGPLDFSFSVIHVPHCVVRP
jgi:hypothetical protein